MCTCTVRVLELRKVHVYAYWRPAQADPLLALGACTRVTVVVLCVCLSVTKLAATYMYLSLIPGHSQFLLHAEKWEGLGGEITCA